MKIKITHLKITNFKGIKDFEFEPSEITEISADNGIGKTTLFDAHNWLWTGKDSQDRKDFEIKPLDSTGKASFRVVSEVQETIEVDGQTITLKRAFEEKWTKKRGSTESEYTGNETSFWWNDVPCNQSEFKRKIDGLISENLIKLLTNPLYFNSKLSWQERRSLLTEISGDVSEADIASQSEDFRNLYETLQRDNKTINEYRKQVAASIRKSKEELEKIPTRIDEAQRAKPEPVNESEINGQIMLLESELSEIDESINDLQKSQQEEYNKVEQKQAEKHRLQTELQEEIQKASEAKNEKITMLTHKLSELESKASDLRLEIDRMSNDRKEILSKIKILTEDTSRLRNDWTRISESEFEPPKDENCASCGRPMEKNFDLDSLKAEFDKSIEIQLSEIKKSGIKNNEEIQALSKQEKQLQDKIIIKDSEMTITNGHKSQVKLDLEQTKLQAIPKTETIRKLESQIESFVIPKVAPIDVTEKQAKKKHIEAEILTLKSKLSVNDQISKLDARISELIQQESKLSQELNKDQGIENLINDFNKALIEEVERKVSGMFKIVRFKMFNELINGGEEPTCVCMVDGVPFSDLNTAMRVNAGLDIINTLSKHFDVFAPIWIDGKESVNNLMSVDSQLICLTVGKEKQLTIK